MDILLPLQQYEDGKGDYTCDRRQWLGQENALSLHDQATKLARTGELLRPANAELLAPKD